MSFKYNILNITLRFYIFTLYSFSMPNSLKLVVTILSKFHYVHSISITLRGRDNEGEKEKEREWKRKRDRGSEREKKRER